MFIIHIILVMLMAFQAAKDGIIIRLNMAFCAIVPDASPVISSGNWEIQVVVIEIGILPIGDIMTSRTIS